MPSTKATLLQRLAALEQKHANESREPPVRIFLPDNGRGDVKVTSPDDPHAVLVIYKPSSGKRGPR